MRIVDVISFLFKQQYADVCWQFCMNHSAFYDHVNKKVQQVLEVWCLQHYSISQFLECKALRDRKSAELRRENAMGLAVYINSLLENDVLSWICTSNKLV
jgi:hypothetical protein